MNQHRKLNIKEMKQVKKRVLNNLIKRDTKGLWIADTTEGKTIRLK